MHAPTESTASHESVDPARPGGLESRLGWRVVDIVVAAVLGVAMGLVFWVWNTIGYAWFEAADALTPGFGGTAVGVWLLGGVVGGLVIRKPGAALLVELVGATVSALIGNVWGPTTIMSGLAQGLGAEAVFAAFGYRRFGIPTAALAGAGAGVGAWLLEFFLFGNIAKTVAFNAIYLSTVVLSGVVLAGILGWLLVRAVAATGALGRFAVGREARREV